MQLSFTDIIMGNLLDSLKDYFDKTPQDVLEKDFKELEYLNEIGPDAIAYVEYVKGNFDMEISCPLLLGVEVSRLAYKSSLSDHLYKANTQFFQAA